MALGRYFAGVRGEDWAGTATPHTPSSAAQLCESDFAACAPRATRTTGLVVMTVALKAPL